jgi:glycosyltransferase involved in cell wall biosynthesis
MMTEPKISVIVPLYNVEKYLRECLDSIVAQTFRDFEVIMINDGSTDRSERIAQEYAEKNPNFFICAGESRIECCPKCRFGERKRAVCSFLDSDDYIVDNALKLLYDKAEELETGVEIYGDMKKWGSRLINCCLIFIRRELIIEHNLKFCEGIIHEDNLYQWLLMAVSKRVSILHEPLYYHRNRRGSITMSNENLYEKWRGFREVSGYGPGSVYLFRGI